MEDGIDPQELYNIVIEGLQNPPTTAEGLYRFIYALTGGESIPFTPVCHELGHKSPWEFVWKAYRIDLPEWKSKTKKNLIVVANRNGQKTLTLAKLILAEMLLKPNCGTLGMAAVQAQAQRCFQYATKYMNHPALVDAGVVTKLLTSYMELENKSKYEQVVATPAGCNSAHLPKFRVDEVDLIKPEILTESMMMPVSFPGLSSHTIFISTRKSLDGVMHSLIKDNAASEQYEIITWCYKETSQPCPESRRGTEKKMYEVEDMDNPGESILVEAYTGCENCPLLPTCRGDLARSRGYVPIEDTIDEFMKLDRATWIAQKECREPKRGNLFFDEWSSKIQLGDYPYNPNLPVDLTFDFTNGGNSPTVCDIFQEDESGNNYLIAALEYVHMGTNQMGDAIVDYCKDIGIKNIRMQIGDSAQMQMIRDLNQHRPEFFRIMPCKKIPRAEGWPLCRKQVKSNDGRRKLFVDRTNAKKFAEEIEKAKISKSDPNDVSKLSRAHHLDAWRYREVRLRYRSGGEPRMRNLLPPGYDDNGSKLPPSSGGQSKDFFGRLFFLDNDND